MPILRSHIEHDFAWSLFLETPEYPISLFAKPHNYGPLLTLPVEYKEVGTDGEICFPGHAVELVNVSISRPDVKLCIRASGRRPRTLCGPWHREGMGMMEQFVVPDGETLCVTAALLPTATPGRVNIYMKALFVKVGRTARS